MKKIMSLFLMSIVGLAGTYAWAGSAREDSVARLQSSVEVLQAVMAASDKGIPEEVLSNAKCVVVVPDLIKGGLIFGAKHGRGVASVAAGPVGRHDHAGTDWKMNTQMLTNYRSKGVLAGLPLEGAVVEQDN